mmetsp:Transcript_36935/g.59514  ORF Transcript_36935/g.59514 Transcript_36935/m.59514 type:complete len:218 (-) Transcript_36935:818-1471(-)
MQDLDQAAFVVELKGHLKSLPDLLAKNFVHSHDDAFPNKLRKIVRHCYAHAFLELLRDDDPVLVPQLLQNQLPRRRLCLPDLHLRLLHPDKGDLRRPLLSSQQDVVRNLAERCDFCHLLKRYNMFFQLLPVVVAGCEDLFQDDVRVFEVPQMLLLALDILINAGQEIELLLGILNLLYEVLPFLQAKNQSPHLLRSIAFLHLLRDNALDFGERCPQL